jgi:hypothetical protein
LIEQLGIKEIHKSEGINERNYRSTYMDIEEDAKHGMILVTEGGWRPLVCDKRRYASVEVWVSS